MSLASAERLAEDPHRLSAFRRALKGRENAVLDALETVRASLALEGLHLAGSGSVPLRPLFVSRAQLAFISRALWQNTTALARAVAAHLETDSEAIRQLYPLPRAHFDALDWATILRSPSFARWLRPDGFLFGNRFAVTEANIGNGSLYSAIYPELMYRVFERSPALAELDVARRVARPLQRLFAMLRRLVAGHAWLSRRRPCLALFAIKEELAQVKADPDERFDAGIAWLPSALERAGWAVCHATEEQLEVDASGHCVHTETGERVDLVLNLFVGLTCLTNPAAFEDALHSYRGERLGDAPIIQPLLCATLDKGAMPLWQTLPCWPATQDSFSVELVPTHYPRAERATEYRLEREAWCMKRSFAGKHTHVGISTPSRAWNSVLATALAGRDYVLQPYERMSVAELPVVRGGRIEWVDFSVELSLFIYQGQYGGGFARVMPAAEGLVMSPPPAGLGLTLLHDA